MSVPPSLPATRPAPPVAAGPGGVGPDAGVARSGWSLRPYLAGLGSLIVHLTAVLAVALVPVARDEDPSAVEVVWTASRDDMADRLVESLAPVEVAMPSQEAPGGSPAAPGGVAESLLRERLLGPASLSGLGGTSAVRFDAGVGGGGRGRTFGGGDGFPGLQSELADQDNVQFFGLQFPARRVAFVVDKSGSMEGRRWTIVKRELLKSLETMSPRQRVTVVLFNTEAFPLFGEPPARTWDDLAAGVPDPNAAEAMLGPTSANVDRIRRWLASFEAGGFTSPMPAMAMAIAYEPDAIVFLTDGEFTDGTIDLLRANRKRVLDLAARAGDQTRRPPRVYTVGMHAIAAAPQLRLIADENEGVYRFVR